MSLGKINVDADPRKFFLVDGIGAVLSAFLLGVVLVRLQEYIGLPVNTLHYLAFAAVIFAFYSFSCFLFSGENWRILLRLIAITNLLYCLVTLGIIFYFFQRVTMLGWFYFIVEIAVVSTLALTELRKANTKT